MNNQTTFISQVYNNINTNLVSNMHNVIATDLSARGSESSDGRYRNFTQNDIICGMSLCGSEEEPTWQFCNRG